MSSILLEVDARRHISLKKIGHHDRYLANEHEDGTITLTPAIVLTPAEIHYLQDAEIQHHVEAGRRAIQSGGVRRLDRKRAK